MFGFKKQPVQYIIVGLGNPGIRYERTRHNTGFTALDYLSQKTGIKADRVKFSALIGRGEIDGINVMLMKPQTFMNNSGQAVNEAARFYDVPHSNIIIIYDDISLQPGKIRIRKKGSDGGHNGIKSICEYLTDNDFPRIKIGVGEKPRPDYDLADWVLSLFASDEYKAVSARFDDVFEAIRLILKGEYDLAMNKYN